MKAMVLAAGFGTRLRPLTLERPKAAVPLGNVPLGAFALRHLADQGVREVVVNLHYMSDQVRAALQQTAPLCMQLAFSYEPEILGTGGGLKKVETRLIQEAQPVVVVNADTFFQPDIHAALQVHARHQAVATMVVRPDPETHAYGAVHVDSAGRVTQLLDAKAPGRAPPARPYMFSGVHVLSPRAFRDLPEQGCIIRTAYRRWIERGEPVAAVVDLSPWSDLGTLGRYLEGNLALARGQWRIPGTETEAERGLVHPEARVEPGAIIRRSVVGPFVHVASGAVVEDSVMWSGARVGAEKLRRTIVTPEHRVDVE